MTTNTIYGDWCNRVDQYATTVEQTVHEAFGTEGPGGFDFDAIVSEYVDKINEALPTSVTLAGAQFYGPAEQQDFDGYPHDDAGALDIRQIVENIDLWEIIMRHEIEEKI